jgi:hypothetical protein
MHRPIHYHLIQTRTAGPDRQARRDALTRAARQDRRTRRHQPGHPVHGLAASWADPPHNSGGHLLQDRNACQRGRSS